MKFFPLLWSSLWRKKIRTIFTLAAVFIAFVLFGLLMTIRTAFSFGVEIAGLDRLVIIHKVSLIMPLPIAYQERLRATEGVDIVSHQSWFGGVYQDPSNFFAQMVVEPEPFMKIYPEFTISPEHVTAWMADRQGAIVGVDRWSVSAGRSAIAFRSWARSGSRSRGRSGSSTSSAPMTAKTVSTRRNSSSATIISTRTGKSATASSAGMW
jgi:hypothetical protein